MDSFMAEERLKSTMTIPKAINLLKDKHAAKMIERHVRALNRIANNCKNGYMLKDLLSLCELLTICNEKLKLSVEYEAPLSRIISVCRLPFLKEKASDEDTFAPCVIETLSLLGRMISSTSPTIRQQIVTAVKTLYEGLDSDEIEVPPMFQQTRFAYNMAMIERSEIARSVAKGLISTAMDDLQEQVEVLTTLAVFSASSCKNCDHILSANGGKTVTKLLASTDNRVIFLAIEILWNLFEKGSHLQVHEQLSVFSSLKYFKGLFRHLMLTSTNQQMKQMRNDFVSLMALLASSSCVPVPFVETGFLKDICDFIVHFDGDNSFVTSDTSYLSDLKLTNDPEDFELIKLLICLLTSLRSLPAATAVFSKQNVLQAVLSYAIPNDVEKTRWNPAQFEEIQLLCLSSLSLLSPLCIHDYMECQGSTRMLLLIDWSIKGDHYAGHGNSFHGDGGRDNKLSELKYCLRVLLSVCSISNNSIVLQDLHEQGVIPLLIGLLRQVTSNPECDNSSILIEIQSDSLLILSYLCQNDNHRKELFGGYEGVLILMGYLQKDPYKFVSELGHDKLLLSAIDCTWSAVVGNNIVEDIFLENGGVFFLMDMLQKCPHKMLPLLLGVMVDICDNPKSLSHVTAWQGNSTTNCWSLIARLWSQEEKNIGVIRDDMGTLAGTTLPLVGAEQSAIGMPPLPTRQPSAAINDINNNSRAKLYALCSKIGFNYPIDSMNAEEKITMCIIENYLSFKTGEVWYEVAGELAQEGLRPTTPDQEDLQEILQSFEERAENVIKQQHELMDEQHRNDLDEEYQFYEKLRDAQFSKERALEKKENLLLRTSNIKHLKEAKEKQQAAIDVSRPSVVSLGERFHTTDFSSLNVTTFCGRHVTIPSTNKTKLLQDNKQLAEVN